MLDALLLREVRRGSEDALARVIDKYTAYVCTIIRNVVGERMTREDIEEAASDVFLAVWERSDGIKNLKAYLGAAARNTAKNRLRTVRETAPLDDEIAAGGATMDDALISEEERNSVRAAVLAMDSPDREIFLRHYYGGQTVAAIVEETGLTEAAVKHRLVRGREKLRPALEKEVFGK
jgi:RNA polymerase sigma-70 factor (ECF subfamily)